MVEISSPRVAKTIQIFAAEILEYWKGKDALEGIIGVDSVDGSSGEAISNLLEEDSCRIVSVDILERIACHRVK
jgi:hypothetical protein